MPIQHVLKQSTLVNCVYVYRLAANNAGAKSCLRLACQAVFLSKNPRGIAELCDSKTSNGWRIDLLRKVPTLSGWMLPSAIV